MPATRWGMADAFLGTAILLGILVVGNADRMPRGVEEFLAVRLSLKNILLLTAFGLAWPGVLWACGLYEPKRLRDGHGEWPRILVASAIAGLIALVFPLTSRSGAARPIHALLFAVIVAPTAVALRAGARAGRATRRRAQARRTLIVGSGPIAAWVYRGFGTDPECRREVVGFVDSDPHPSLVATGLAHLGGVSQLEELLMHEVVDEVVIALPVKSRYEEIQQTIAACELVGVPATYPAPLFRTRVSQPPRIENRADTPVMAMAVAPDDYRLVVKRGVDLAGATFLLVVLSPLLLIISAAIKLTSPGPVLFAQERYGYMKRRFRMQKFRTMRVDAERLQAALEQWNEAAGPIFKIRNDPRITPVGRFLRRSSLDELPQLWHVLTGEMSLVGPRPMSLRDVSRFEDPWLMRRFSVRPGLTCLWQISGRSNVGFERWIELDLNYIDRWSLGLDFIILARTVPAVLRGVGAV
jgi:exopolysaccharide biosynthesis polyprenyl glycosylphosphotransferase